MGEALRQQNLKLAVADYVAFGSASQSVAPLLNAQIDPSVGHKICWRWCIGASSGKQTLWIASTSSNSHPGLCT
jgi:hypothetical protein